MITEETIAKVKSSLQAAKGFLALEVIEEIEKENEELKADKEWLDNTNNEQTKVILELQKQIEKMKCCGNCKHYKQTNNYLVGTCKGKYNIEGDNICYEWEWKNE